MILVRECKADRAAGLSSRATAFREANVSVRASDLQGLGSQIGASPITDANCPRSSDRSERRLAKPNVLGAIPAVDASVKAPVPQQQQGEFRKLVIVGASPTRGSSLRHLQCGWRRLPTVASAKVGFVFELPGYGWQAIRIVV